MNILANAVCLHTCALNAEQLNANRPYLAYLGEYLGTYLGTYL